MVAAGALLVAVVIIVTVFPYDRAQPQAKEADVWWRQAALNRRDHNNSHRRDMGVDS